MVVKYNINSNGRKIKCFEFDGLVEQLETIMPQIKNNVYGIVDELKENSEGGWNGKYTLEQTLNGMKYGFKAETDYFLDCIEEIRTQDALSEGMYMDVEGYAYDIGSVVQGVPECCINTGLPTPTPSVTIMVDISFSCVFGSNQLNNRGIAITNLVNTLLLNGYIVDLYFMMYNTQSDMDIMYTIKVDTKSMPISSIAFMSSTDYFRKIGFITMDYIRGKQSGWGRGQSTMHDFMLNKFKKNDIFFIGGGYSNNELSSHLGSPQEADKYLLLMFEKFCKEHKIKITFRKDVDIESNAC